MVKNFLDFYRENYILNVELDIYLEKEVTSSIDSLAFLILNMAMNSVSYNMEYLEDEKEICYKCIYNKMDLVRKAINRYLILEEEVVGEWREMIEVARDKFNEWCIFINSNYKMNTPEAHVFITNPSYDDIQAEMEEDEEGYLSLN
jgi:hypothetical protein